MLTETRTEAVQKGRLMECASAARPRSDRGAIREWCDILGRRGAVELAVLVTLFYWLFSDHLVRLYEFWKTPDWSHGFVIPLFSLYVIHTRRRELSEGRHEGSLWGVPVLILSVAGYIWCIANRIGYPQTLAMVPAIAGLILLMRGWRTLRLLLFPLGMLVLAMPPPMRRYLAMTQPLQQLVARISAFVLNAFPGVDEVSRQGFHISYYMTNGRHNAFAVANACSGMRSLMAFIFLGLAIAYFAPRPTWQRIVLVALVLPVAVFCNFVRVVVTGAFQMYGHEELASGTAHSLLGFGLFGLGLAIFMGLVWMMDHLFVDERTDAAAKPEARS